MTEFIIRWKLKRDKRKWKKKVRAIGVKKSKKFGKSNTKIVIKCQRNSVLSLSMYSNKFIKLD